VKFLPFDQDRHNVNILQRVKRLERATEQGERPQTYEISPASQYGAVAVTTLADTPEWDVWTGGQLVAIILRLRTGGSSNTVATYFVIGSSIGTVTLASTETRQVAYLGDYRVKNGDGISVVITTAGTGAKGLSAFVRMKG
jgi:hypothetical protein